MWRVSNLCTTRRHSVYYTMTSQATFFQACVFTIHTSLGLNKQLPFSEEYIWAITHLFTFTFAFTTELETSCLIKFYRARKWFLLPRWKSWRFLFGSCRIQCSWKCATRWLCLLFSSKNIYRNSNSLLNTFSISFHIFKASNIQKIIESVTGPISQVSALLIAWPGSKIFKLKKVN